jgi:Tfp pilus assembly protein PilV
MRSSNAERTARRRGDSGVAVLEVLVLGVGLLVPLLYGAISVMQVQAASFAATSAAREAARVHVGAATPAEGRRLARRAAATVLADAGVRASSVGIRCVGGCLAPGSRTDVTVTVDVALPLLPGDRSVRVVVAESMPVDRYRSTS